MDFTSESGSREELKMLSMKTYKHMIKDGTSPLQQILVVPLSFRDKVVDMGMLRVH